MRGIWRLAVVSALAVAAFVLALVSFEAVPATECQMDAAADASYSVRFVTPPRSDATTQSMRVTRGDDPVAGAQVCLRAAVEGMSGMSVSDVAVETSPGVYDVPVRFERSGSWDGTVIVTGDGAKAVGIPVSIEVG